MNEVTPIQPPGAGLHGWLPMETAPKDGTIVRLLVAFTEHPLEDTDEPLVTIGGNTSDNTQEDEPWKFAGWSWEQDCFTQGEGMPQGWLPMLGGSASPQIVCERDNWKRWCEEAEERNRTVERRILEAMADWVAASWHAEVANRPLVNVHRRSLDDVWRQVFRHLGFDDRARLGPTHDELMASAPTGVR